MLYRILPILAILGACTLPDPCRAVPRLCRPYVDAGRHDVSVPAVESGRATGAGSGSDVAGMAGMPTAGAGDFPTFDAGRPDSSLPDAAINTDASLDIDSSVHRDAANDDDDASTPAPPRRRDMLIGTNFWYLASWSGEQPMRSDIDWSTAYPMGVNIWNPAWLAELAPYSVLRFMDWGNVNFSKLTSWSQRRLPTADNSEAYIDAQSDPPDPGLAYEWMIDLGNRTHKDIWICVPAMADADFWTQLARLVKAKLDPSLRVYVEWSNETWNGGFSQFQYTLDQGVALDLPGSNKWYQGQAYAVLQSLRMFRAFEQVFGADAIGMRVVRVFAYGGNTDTGRQALANVYESPDYNPDATQIDALAIAPYIGSGLDGASSSIQDDFHAAILREETTEPLANAVRDRATFTIPRLIAYEGGQTLSTNADAWNSNPAIYSEYTFMLDEWSQYFDLFVHYTHTGRWQSDKAWGAIDHTGQSLADAPKYRAIVDWLASH